MCFSRLAGCICWDLYHATFYIEDEFSKDFPLEIHGTINTIIANTRHYCRILQRIFPLFLKSKGAVHILFRSYIIYGCAD